MYARIIEKRLKKDLFQGKIIILYGPRQVGKTTLSKQLLADYPEKNGLYFDCESQIVHDFLIPNPAAIKDRIGDAKLVVFDEAQYVSDIGRTLKVFHDAHPDIQLIVTGSSAFDLAQKTAESLAGRVREYHLFPLSVEEIIQTDGRVSFDAREEIFYRFGMYPGIVQLGQDQMATDLATLQSAVLYKDILALEGVQKPKLLINLLKALALQIGSEVSNGSLANQLNTSVPTIDKYIDLLEKMFIIKRLYALSRNPRVEIRKGFKVYFIDLGIRNSIIQNHNLLDIRSDVGSLFENFFVIERLKYLSNHGLTANTYFWRTVDKKEIDYVEERDGQLFGYECTLSDKKLTAVAKKFQLLYPTASPVTLVNQENLVSFLQ